MRIAITGTSGLVGFDLWEALKTGHELWAIGRRRPKFVPETHWRSTDIVDATETQQVVQAINPDCLIHLAAISSPDACELDAQTGYKTNMLGTRNLALACQRFDTEMVYVSTDQVFDGKKTSPYTELDDPHPINHYGRSKFFGEEFVRNLLRRYYVVRTALVFGQSRSTFIDRIIQAVKGEEKIVAAADLVNSPTSAKDLAGALTHLIETHLYGTYHIVNEGHCSRYELSSFVARSLRGEVSRIRRGSQRTLRLPAPRPGYTPLENFSWHLNGFPEIPTWQEAVTRFLEERTE
jgi:dTDP-4-dehydrorhamnose reductase